MEFRHWGSDVPTGETYLAAKSKEKQLYSQAKISYLYTIHLHWLILEFQFILFHISSYVTTKVLIEKIVGKKLIDGSKEWHGYTYQIFATRNSAVNAEICYCYLVKKLPYVVRYLVLNKVIFE